MLRLLVSLLVALGLAFAPAMMAAARTSPATGHDAAAAAQVPDHCRGTPPASDRGKADLNTCCSTACPMTAALPAASAAGKAQARPADPESALPAVFAGFDPERETPPPRSAPII